MESWRLLPGHTRRARPELIDHDAEIGITCTNSG